MTPHDGGRMSATQLGLDLTPIGAVAAMLDAARALDAANYTDESVTYQESKDRRASIAARLRTLAGEP